MIEYDGKVVDDFSSLYLGLFSDKSITCLIYLFIFQISSSMPLLGVSLKLMLCIAEIPGFWSIVWYVELPDEI